jgi:AAA family ATP:ADP antiporter
MRKLFHKLFDIRGGEGFKATLMFTYVFLLTASLLIIKPVRNSLFLVKFGAEKLPYVFMLVALFSAVVASIYAKYSKKVRLNYLISMTLLICIGCLLLIWFMLHSGYQGSWFLYAFYVWVAIFAVITSAQFWLLANYVFNAREAKRLFGLIGAGAISGGIFGGLLAKYLALELKTENLIFLCIGFLIICLFLLWLVWEKYGRHGYGERTYKHREIQQSETPDNPIKLIINSRHLTYLAGIIGLGVIVATLVEFQFNAVAIQEITETDGLTAFFGLWMSIFSIASLVIQLFLTNKIMKHLGVAASLFFLPAGLFLGAVAILINPALWSAILIKVSDGSFKHSINKAGTELLILPISSEIKNKAKAFIDVFIKNFAEGLGGILLLILTVSIQHISLIIIPLIVLWTYLIFRVKNEYINSFRLAIEKRTIDIEEQSVNLQDASVLKNFIKVLEGKNERQILHVLKLLEDVKDKELIPWMTRLIKHPSDEIKANVLRMALLYDELDLTEEASHLIDSRDQTVRIEAIYYLCKHSDDKTSALKAYLIDHEDYRVRSSALMCASREWKESKAFRKEIDLISVLDEMLKRLPKQKEEEEQSRIIKINAAKVIGEVNDPKLYPYLRIFLDDEIQDVVQAAVTSIGQIQEKEFVPILITHLRTKHIRKYARESLAEFGEDIIDILTEHLEKDDKDKKERLAVPKVFALIGSQKSVNILTKNLGQRDLHLRFEIIRALNKLRIKFQELKFDMHSIKSRILEEITQYNRTLALWIQQNTGLEFAQTAVPSDNDPDQAQKARKLLITALEEKLDNSLERIFRLLGLHYPPKDMYDAYLGIKSNKSHLRANSVEFLDNILDPKLKRILIPIVDTTRTNILVDSPLEISGFEVPSEFECINHILQSHDNWLKSCALHLVAELNDNKFIDIISKLVDDPDTIVRETAKYCLEKVGT